MVASVPDMIRESLKVVRLQNRITQVLEPSEARRLLQGFRDTPSTVDPPHNASHLLGVASEILQTPETVPGVIIEAGCFKGGSTAKLSLVASQVGRTLVAFDSFQGLPTNEEPHEITIYGESIKGWFEPGQFSGTLDEVVNNVTRFGEVSACRFVEGWFEDTMPGFQEPIAAAYLDVDLAASTRTCLKYLYPMISSGGLLVSQDGDFPLVLEVFNDDRFWEVEVGSEKPDIQGLGKDKLLTIRKP